MRRKYYIYILYDNLLGKYFYVGCSTDLSTRLWQHKKTFGKSTSIEQIQQIFTTRENAHKIEKYWINNFVLWGEKIINRTNNPAKIARSNVALQLPALFGKFYLPGSGF